MQQQFILQIFSLRQLWDYRQHRVALLPWQIIKVLKGSEKAHFKQIWVPARGTMQRRRKDLGGAQDGKTKLANCVFFVVLAMRRSQRRTKGNGGIWCKGQVSLPAPKLPVVHSHHVRSSICRAVLQSWRYQGRSSLGFPSHSVEQKLKGLRPFHGGDVWCHWPYIIQQNTDADHNKSVQLPSLWMPKINIKLLLASKVWGQLNPSEIPPRDHLVLQVSSYRR